MNKTPRNLTLYTDGVSFVFYIFYAFVCNIFLWSVTSHLLSIGNTFSYTYQSSLVIFIVLLLVGFYYFTLYILANRIIVSKTGISFRYFGYRYSLRDYLFVPTISHSLTWDQVFLVLPNSLSDLPRSFSCISRGKLRETLFFSGKLVGKFGSCYGNLPSFLVILKDGRSRLVYTDPFSRRSLVRLFSCIMSRGIIVFGPLDALTPTNRSHSVPTTTNIV